MRLYLLRHGIAEEQASGGDAQRKLTDEGKSKLSEVLKRAAKSGVKPGLVLTSPYLRAAETAEIAAKILECPVAPAQTEALVPYGTPQGVWDEVRAHKEVEQLMLSGHEPLLSQSVSFLLNSPALQVDMKKGAIISIEFQSFRVEPKGVLKWMLTPKLC